MPPCSRQKEPSRRCWACCRRSCHPVAAAESARSVRNRSDGFGVSHGAQGRGGNGRGAHPAADCTRARRPSGIRCPPARCHEHPGRRRRAVTLPFGLVGQLTAVMVASAPIAAFRGAGLVVLERQLLYKRIATAETAETMVYYVWTIVTVAVGWGLWGLATATVARSIVGTAFIVATVTDRDRLAALRPPAYPRACSGSACASRRSTSWWRSAIRFWSSVRRLSEASRSSPTGASSCERSRRPGSSCGRCCACPSRRCLGQGPPAGIPAACCHGSAGRNNPCRHAARAAGGCRTGSRAATVRPGWSPAVDCSLGGVPGGRYSHAVDDRRPELSSGPPVTRSRPSAP